MGKVMNVVMIKNDNEIDFEIAVTKTINDAEKRGYSCRVVYAPLMKQNDEPLYIAFVEEIS